MTFSLENWKEFITDVEQERKAWLEQAKKSWKELNKKQRQNSLWSVSPNSPKKRVNYPFWWSAFKVRQPIIFSRPGLPIGKDTTGGDDPTGRTSALCLERLANAILKTFDAKSMFRAACDDYLATDFGTNRAFYECEDVFEPYKMRLVEEQNQNGNVYFIDENGDIVEDPNTIQIDEAGAYIETEKKVGVENERVYLDRVLYSDLLFDPDATYWERGRRLAWKQNYSVSEYKDIFGNEAMSFLSSDEIKEVGKKRKCITVYECWDFFDKKTVWFAENGTDFIKPKAIKELEKEGEQDPDKNLYNLEKFFPCVKPLIKNAPTDDFYPVPEFFQIADLVEELHTLASRMYSLTRAIRIRLLFDSGVKGLQSLINEVGETDAIGVPNLAQSLANGAGNLENYVAYLPIAPMVEGLGNMYTAVQNRLDTLWQLIGISEIMRGQVNSNDDSRTYGEQQMQAKYGMSRLTPDIERVQEYIRDNIELLTEMALKNFSDESLKQYIAPQTMEPEHQQRFAAALELLRNDRKRRFRIELDTDSTIAINEDYDRKLRSELVNGLAKSLESTANTAETNPEIAVTELKLLLHFCRGFRQGKVFEDEITQSIDAVIKKYQDPQSQNKPNADLLMAQAELRKADAMAQKNQFDAQNESASIQKDLVIAADKIRMDMQQLEIDRQQAVWDYEKAVADYQLKIQQTQLLREQLMIEIQKANQSEETKRMKLELENQIAASDHQLGLMAQQLSEYKVNLDEREKYATEARLQAEQKLEEFRAQQDAVAQRIQAFQTAQTAQMAQPAATMPPITVVNNPSKPTRRVTKVVRDASGNMVGTESLDLPIEHEVVG